MSALRGVATSPARRWVFTGAVVLCASVVCLPVHSLPDADALIKAADSVGERSIEARLSGAFQWQPLKRRIHTNAPSRLLRIASGLNQRLRSERTSPNVCAAGAALVLVGRTAGATKLLGEGLIRSTGQAEILDAVQKSYDRTLLIDFSASLLTQASTNSDAKSLLLAFESADRACRLGAVPEALWNRALAIQQLGLSTLAARAWQEAADVDQTSSWAQEARERKREALRLAEVGPPVSEELFVQRELFSLATIVAREALTTADGAMMSPSFKQLAEAGRQRDAVSGDHLVSDAVGSLRRVVQSGSESDWNRLLSALVSFARGRSDVENDRPADALLAFREAENGFRAARSPLELLARDQRIRCECWHHDTTCLSGFQALHAELANIGRYPWLTARVVYAEAQTLYRQGRIYEAAELFRIAQEGFRKTNDAAGVALMDSLLANVLAIAGETDQAASHYLAGLRLPAPPIGDRRRRQLGDFTVFLLRHGFISTTELVLNELDRWPATDEGQVEAATLRGVINARRGNTAAAAVHFRRAHALLEKVGDETVRADVANSLSVAEAGSRGYGAGASRGDIDAAIARHEKFNDSVLLPQLLVERGALLEAANETVRAKSDYFRAMDLLEVRTPRIDRMLMGFGIDSQIDLPFDRAIRLLLNEKRFAEALAVADRSRALRISALYASAAGLPDPFRAAPDQRTADVLADLRPLLKSGQVIVFQHLLREELVCWIMTSSAIDVVRRPVAAAALITVVEQLRRCVSMPACGDERLTEQVSNLLIRAWIDSVPRNATLIVIPPPELNSVPFSMLKTAAGEVLLRRNAVVTSPGLRAYVRAEKTDAARRTSGVAFFAAAPYPGGGRVPLPLAGREVSMASRAYPHAVVDAHATRERFLKEAASSSIIHFAGHAAVNPQQPLLSALVFEPGEPQLLYVHEVDEALFPKARLVVLSACETGVTPKPMMSFAHALMNQGLPSVVYTSWPVADAAAQEFAIEFHRNLAGGETRAAALRKAQLVLLRNHPDRKEIWAAFAISGAIGRLTE